MGALCVSVAIVSSVVVAALSATAGSALAAGNTSCGKPWRHANAGTVHTCRLWPSGPIPVRARADATSPVVGVLKRGGWANWFDSQTRGRSYTERGAVNDWYAHTKADNGRWGYVTEVYFARGDDNESDARLPVKAAPVVEPRRRPVQTTGGCARASVRKQCFNRALEYMLREMIVNARSRTARLIDGLNDTVGCGEFCDGQKLAAFKEFHSQVKSGGPWDHKPKLQRMFRMRCPDGRCEFLDDQYMDVPGTDLRLRYDIWSNVHYGYVGRHAGFEEFELQGAHQLPVPGTGETSPADIVFVQIGLDLYRKYPKAASLTQRRLKRAIVTRLSEIRRAGREEDHNPVLERTR